MFEFRPATRTHAQIEGSPALPPAPVPLPERAQPVRYRIYQATFPGRRYGSLGYALSRLGPVFLDGMVAIDRRIGEPLNRSAGGRPFDFHPVNG